MKILMPLLLLFLLSCSHRNDASHLPSPLELPGAIIGTTIDNAIYGHKRTKVKRYIVAHYDALKPEIKAGDGRHVDALLDVSDIKTSHSSRIKHELQQEFDTMFKNVQLSTEAVMQTFSSLYLPQKGTKTINGFTYTHAYNIVQGYLNENFEVFRLSLKNKTTTGFIPLTKILHINESVKQKYFYESLWKRYDALIIEPVVVTVMVKE